MYAKVYITNVTENYIFNSYLSNFFELISFNIKKKCLSSDFQLEGENNVIIFFIFKFVLS